MGFLKTLVLRTTPRCLLWRLKARRHARFLRDLSPDAEPEFVPIPSLLGRGDTAVDVGANFGIYTSLFSRLVGPDGEVHAVEPVPDTFRVLRACVSSLGQGNVRLHQTALSDRDGEGIMMSPPYERGGSNDYKAFVAEGSPALGPGRRHAVRLARLDALLEGARGPIRFVKIDVEGHELPVVRGGLEAIRRWKPALLIEVSRNPDDPSSSGHELFRILRLMGYEPYWCRGGTLVPRAKGDRSVNYFFLTRAHLDRLPGAGAPGTPPPGR